VTKVLSSFWKIQI